MIRTNVVGCLNLVDTCMQKGIHVTYYGTGCIFHYDKDFPEGSGKGFKESDTPNFTGSYYSYTKVRRRHRGGDKVGVGGFVGSNCTPCCCEIARWLTWPLRRSIAVLAALYTCAIK